MQLTSTVKLYTTKEEEAVISRIMDAYIQTVNDLIQLSVSGTSISKYTSADISIDLPSALKNQAIRDAQSSVSKYHKILKKVQSVNKKRIKNNQKLLKTPNVPIWKKPCCYVNNQNFKIKNGCIPFPVWMNGTSKRINIRTKMTDIQKAIFDQSKLGMLRIVYKSGKLYAQVTYEIQENASIQSGVVMGIDLGIKCPAVSCLDNGKVRFYGNGRKNKYLRRHYAYLRKKLQEKKKRKALLKINNKEQRIMNDIDHKISRRIINHALANNVQIIRMEQLSKIRSTTRTSRKNNHSLHNWSFYRLQQYIEYKAKLAGITVEYVNPSYTSQICPACSKKNKVKDRLYRCSCGYIKHRDIVGAENICKTTEPGGHRILPVSLVA